MSIENKVLSFFSTVALLSYLGVFMLNRTPPVPDPVDYPTFSYVICTDDHDIRYYDRSLDLVFVDLGIKGCETVTIRYVPPQDMYYGSGRAEDINWSDPAYGDREFDRNNYDHYRFSIRE